MVLNFPVLADYAVLPVGQRPGLRYPRPCVQPEPSAAPCPGDILLHGHTHVPAKDSRLGFWYLNPGSVSLPKENQPPQLYDTGNGVFAWKNLEGVEYDQLVL